MRSETPERLYKRASKLHGKGEKAYNSGHYDLAEAFYNNANELRKMARGND
ncbi:MAG: hypothetical protein ABIF40_05015 [archaeon]